MTGDGLIFFLVQSGWSLLQMGLSKMTSIFWGFAPIQCKIKHVTHLTRYFWYIATNLRLVNEVMFGETPGLLMTLEGSEVFGQWGREV